MEAQLSGTADGTLSSKYTGYWGCWWPSFMFSICKSLTQKPHSVKNFMNLDTKSYN